MNYQRFGKELTLIYKKYLEFFKDNNDGTVEYILVKGFNNQYQKIFLDHQLLTCRLLVIHEKVFELPEEYLEE